MVRLVPHPFDWLHTEGLMTERDVVGPSLFPGASEAESSGAPFVWAPAGRPQARTAAPRVHAALRSGAPAPPERASAPGGRGTPGCLGDVPKRRPRARTARGHAREGPEAARGGPQGRRKPRRQAVCPRSGDADDAQIFDKRQQAVRSGAPKRCKTGAEVRSAPIRISAYFLPTGAVVYGCGQKKARGAKLRGPEQQSGTACLH